jgi:DNA-binding NarL/FixJ family response regulator
MTRILIADDHDVVRSGIRAILEDRVGWEIVAEAASGKEAIEQALATKPDVVVLDYSLPLMNGVEVTRQICTRLPGTQVLIFTMHDTDDLVLEALAAGARGFLLKSDAKKLLTKAVESLAARRPYFTGKVSEALLETFVEAKKQEVTRFSPRERSVMQLIAEGHGHREIARILGVSEKTVESHRANVMKKGSFTSTAALIRYAIRNNIVEA